MNVTNNELIQAYKEEENNRKKERLYAICMIKVNKHTIADTARDMFRTYQCVHNWLLRFEEYGLGWSGRSLTFRPSTNNPIQKTRKNKMIVQETFRRHDTKKTNAVHI